MLATARAAADAHLLVAEQNRLQWRHALTREVVLATLLPPERSSLALRAAAALRARGGDDDESAAAELLASCRRSRQGRRDPGYARSHATSPRVRCAAPSNGWSQLSEMGSLPVQVAMERVRLYTLTGDANRALEVGAAALDSSTGEEHAELCLRLARVGDRGQTLGRCRGLRSVRAGRPDDARSSVLLAEAAHGAGQIDVAIVPREPSRRG